jgi:hypothetical protein
VVEQPVEELELVESMVEPLVEVLLQVWQAEVSEEALVSSYC